jgi:hypothetical protein
MTTPREIFRELLCEAKNNTTTPECIYIERDNTRLESNGYFVRYGRTLNLRKWESRSRVRYYELIDGSIHAFDSDLASNSRIRNGSYARYSLGDPNIVTALREDMENNICGGVR